MRHSEHTGHTERTKAMGRYLKAVREQSGLTQAQLADRLGCKQPVVARLEAGGVSPNLSTLQRVAAALGRELQLRMIEVGSERISA